MGCKIQTTLIKKSGVVNSGLFYYLLADAAYLNRRHPPGLALVKRPQKGQLTS